MTTQHAVDPDSQRLHDAAEAALAERMRAQGRSPHGYTADEYAEALEEASAAEPFQAAGDLAAVLAEMGETERVTATDLARRQAIILADRGLLDLDGEQLPDLARVPSGERRDAMRQAIDELGKPGEPNKDTVARQQALKHMMLGRALDAGVILAAEYGSFEALYDADPEETTRLLEARGVEIPGRTPPSPFSDPDYREAALPFIQLDGSGDVTLPDEHGVREHMAAVKILAKAGLIKNGKDTSTVDQYLAALELVRELAEDGVDVDDHLTATTTRLKANGHWRLDVDNEPSADQWLHAAGVRH